MAALDESLMATLTQEERDAMHQADEADAATTQDASVTQDPAETPLDAPHEGQAEVKPEARTDAPKTEPGSEAPTAQRIESTGAPSADAPQAMADGLTPTTPTAPTAPTTPTVPSRTQPLPRYEAKLPEDFAEQVKALAAKEAELKRQFKAGELEFDDFELAREALLTQREALTLARTKAEISQEMNAQNAEQLWLHTVNTFVDTVASRDQAAGGIDYRKDAAKASDLDQFVRGLAAQAEHADKSMEWFLTEAHRRVLALHGLSQPAAMPAANSAAKPAADTAALKAAVVADRKPPLEAAPKSLAVIPGGEGPGDVESEFSAVLALDGFDYEQAIARMSPAQRERFLRAA